ncbi:MAG: hypothetical protein FWE14_05055 [Lachnospiraceae bacterium]|nr:hypothetical protein [Lachnospiraceae bacterium]
MIVRKTKIASKIGQYKYISFDIFDTLIKRNVSKPSDIFLLVEERYNCENPEDKIKGFLYTRRQTAKEIRDMNPNKEITINEIYDKIPLEKSQKAELKRLEIDIELKACQRNPEIYDLYQMCLSRNQKVILTSDMYLTQDIIEMILAKNGITNYHKLYLSSEISLKKSTGDLFDFLLKDLEISPKNLLHIGDNKRADLMKPFLRGIRVSYIPRRNIKTLYITEKEIYDSTLEKGLVYSFINNQLNFYIKKDRAFRLGYEVLGPLVFGFCEFIHNYAKKEDINTLFFMARDAYIIKKAYEYMFPESSIRYEYTYITRASLRIYYLLNRNGIDDLHHTMSPHRKYSIEELIMAIKLNPKDYETVCHKDGLCLNSKISAKDIINYQELYKALQRDMKEQTESVNDLIIYLKQCGFYKNVGIVDIGWYGTAQQMLNRFTETNELNTNTIGLYCGFIKGNKIKNDINVHAYWYTCDEIEWELNYKDIFSPLENLLLPAEGTTLGYKNIKGMVTALTAEREQYPVKWLSGLHEGALQFVKDYNSLKLTNIPMYSDVSNNPFKNLVSKPKLCDAVIIGDFEFENNRTMKNRNIAKPRKRICYFIFPWLFIKDLKYSYWKGGFLKRVFLLNLNYFTIYSFIKMISKRDKSKQKGNK